MGIQEKIDMKAKIRKARSEDVPRLAQLWHEMALLHARQGKYWQVKRGCARKYEEHIGKMIADHKGGIWVAAVEDDIIGFVVAQVAKRASCFVKNDYGIIADLAVTKSYRRKGIGEKLCRKALRWFADQGLDVVENRVSVDNPLANGFWTKMGFHPYMSMMKMEL